MLINTLRLYERALLGLADEDPDVQAFAKGCISYLILHIHKRQIILPPPVVAMLDHLPEGHIL